MEDWNKLREANERHVRRLFKDFLYLLEDLHKEHCINFEKLKRNAPEGFCASIDLADYFDNSKMQHLRKRVLDLGNDSIRNSQEDFENYTVIFKFKD